MPRAGMIAVVGKPNAGKSTLLNRMVGEKLAIVSPKPQSTRDRVVGIRTVGDRQMILLDTPGLLDPKYHLQRAMRATALKALDDADVIIHVADATEGLPRSLAEEAGLERAPRGALILALNKDDLLRPAVRDDLRERSPGAHFISAVTGEGVDALIDHASGMLPESPLLYPDDEISTQSMRYFAAEFVRETALEQLGDEVPYSVACQVEEFREDRSPVYIRAVLYVERDSQKQILIGAGGARIRAIGTAARQKIEVLVGGPVYLDLWVKVLKNWRRNVAALTRLGYALPDTRSR